MNSKQFGYLLLGLSALLQIICIAITYTLWIKNGITGLVVGYLISIPLFLGLYLVLHKVKIDDSPIVDYLSEIPWILVAVLGTMLAGMGALIALSWKSQHSLLISAAIPVVTTAILFGCMAASNKIMKN